MANAIIAAFNRADECTLTGGSWEASLPLNNLKTRPLGKVARSTDDSNASTKFDVACVQARNVRVVGLANHNLGLDARVRVTAASDSGFTSVLYAGDWVDSWPVMYPSATLSWEADNWWTGKYTAEELEGYTPLYKLILPNNVKARYWRIEIDDTTNPDGYVQIGRLVLMAGWQPVTNIIYGSGIGWETGTEVQEAASGAEYFNVKNPGRVARFSLDFMGTDEAMARDFELQRRGGIDKEILFIWDPDDTTHAHRRSFLGRMRQLSMIEQPNFDNNRVSHEVKELLP